MAMLLVTREMPRFGHAGYIQKDRRKRLPAAMRVLAVFSFWWQLA